MGSFGGLNFHSFGPMKYFAEILSQFIGQERLKNIDNYSRGAYLLSVLALIFSIIL